MKKKYDRYLTDRIDKAIAKRAKTAEMVELKSKIEKDYKLIPSGDIDDEARLIAIRWVEGYEKMGIIELEQKHKLASDFMNYARHKLESKEAELSRLKVIAGKMKDALNGTDRLNDNSKDVREALTAYAEFCKEK